jgi:hypothetical protein
MKDGVKEFGVTGHFHGGGVKYLSNDLLTRQNLGLTVRILMV